jgi:hypothetical protein
MKVSINMQLDDARCGAEGTPVVDACGDNRSAPVPYRPAATFVTQLAANFLQLPQTRVRRRLEPDKAARSYAANDKDSQTRGTRLSEEC